MKPVLILQVRPESVAADDEYAAILAKGGLAAEETRRIRLEREPDHPALSPERVLEEHAAIVVGGGPGCVSDPAEGKSEDDRRIEGALDRLMPRVLEADFPFLGCCYGIGLLASRLGAEVSKARYGEPVGAVDCTLTAAGRDDPLLEGLPERFRAFVGHKEAVQALPRGCAHLVASAPCPYQMIRHGRRVYATQFHPEADSAGFATRISVYRDAGYFPPEEADALLAACRAEDVHVPERILRRFVARHRETGRSTSA